ncbi:hypothetical protein MN116_006755 [Schistosoma mekongi]|uniref:Uncharacterized protein n=1 Tax=Schistosoma mekongi TaxID=38744 RepID=A0AAE1Z982_SCHME|nr:hypothetical protein MN116_006755 [Schistosoma mekongi]
MLEVSCNGNDHSVIRFNREHEHTTSFNVKYRNDYLVNNSNNGFTGYDGVLENLSSARRTFSLGMAPQSQSTPGCKDQDSSTTRLHSPSNIIHIDSPHQHLACTGDGFGIPKSFPDCSQDTFESLDVQPPLLDYLVRHHAISEDSSLKILQADKLQRPFLLLRAIGLPVFNGVIVSSRSSPSSYSPPPGLALLLNALRHTGQHELASYLDYSRRINPSPSSVCSGIDTGFSELPDKRRRGQISLWIQLLAIKVSPALYNQLTLITFKNKTNDNAILPSHIEKLQKHNKPFNDQEEPKFCHLERLPSLPMWIDYTTAPGQTTHTSQTDINYAEPAGKSVKNVHNHWIKLLLPLICCFQRSKAPNEMPGKNPSENSVHSFTKPNQANDQTQRDISLHQNSSTDNSTDPAFVCTNDCRSRIASRAILDNKSLQFYNSILENDSSLHNAIVKYLEQSSGVLVLDCKLGSFSQTCSSDETTLKSVSALCVVLIATQSEIIKRLSENCSLYSSEIEPSSKETNYLRLSEVKTLPDKLMLTSKLADDLATVLIRAGVLRQLELQNLRLSVTLDPSEVQLAIKELMDLED